MSELTVKRFAKIIGKTLATLVIGSVLVACTPANLNTSSATASYASADEAFANKQYEQALQLYQATIKTSPEDTEAWFGLAASADLVGDFELADQAYSQLQPSFGDTARFLNNLGYSHLLRGDLLIAREHFIRVLDMDPENDTALGNLQMLQNLVSENSEQ